MPASTRRALGVVVAATGIVLAVLGAWVVVTLGPSGAAHFSATSKAPGAIVVPSNVLNAVDVPVRVTAQRRDGGAVLLVVAPSSDAGAVLAGSAVSTVTSVHFPAGSMDLHASGAGAPNDISTADVWRLAERGTSGVAKLSVDQGTAPGSLSGGPEALVVTSGDTTGLSDVTVTLTWANRAWFFEALAVATIGAILAAFALNDLWQGRAPAPKSEVAQAMGSEATR